MRTPQRFTVAAALSALALSVTACAGSSQAPVPPSVAPSAATPTPSAAPTPRAAGVTTAADTFGPACGQLPQGNDPGSLSAMGPQPVVSAASTNPLLTTLVSAVKAAGLVQTLNQQQAITVFAPYDGAFEEAKKSMGEQRFGALLQNKDGLGQVLQYHVVPKRYDRAGLDSAGEVMPLVGGPLRIKNSGSGMTVTDGAGNTANVLCGNIPTANATVFVIDKVLMQG